MMTRLIMLTISAFGTAASAPTHLNALVTSDAASEKSCRPNEALLRGICNDMYSRTEDRSEPDLWTYRYEKKIYDASCVDFKSDTPASARGKIQHLFSIRPQALQCDALNFPVQQGHILKYAIQMETYSIVDNAVRWKIDLNLIDHADRQTLLDFTLTRAAMHNSVRTLLSDYYIKLRKNSAKHCFEIRPDSDCGRSAKDIAGMQRALGL